MLKLIITLTIISSTIFGQIKPENQELYNHIMEELYESAYEMNLYYNGFYEDSNIILFFQGQFNAYNDMKNFLESAN